MRDPESQTPATTPGLQALSHYHGSPWLKPVPVPERKGSKNPKQPPDTRISAEKLLGKVRCIGDTEWELPCSTRSSRLGAAHPGPPRPGLLARELQSWGCSPGASRPGTAHPGPRVPGLLARGHQSWGSSPKASRPGPARPRPPRPGCWPGASSSEAARPGHPRQGLHSPASSPGAAHPGPPRLGPPGPRLLARGFLATQIYGPLVG